MGEGFGRGKERRGEGIQSRKKAKLKRRFIRHRLQGIAMMSAFVLLAYFFSPAAALAALRAFLSKATSGLVTFPSSLPPD